jgi:cytochrome c2/sporulation protein YlmC with PRC-barrel domain
MGRTSAGLALTAALCCVSIDVARATCAEDLTRAQTALATASPADHARLDSAIAEAEAKARAKDTAGCDAAMAQVLSILHLPSLATVTLSTPMAEPEPATPANNPSGPAAPRAGSSSDASASSPPPSAALATPASRAGGTASAGQTSAISQAQSASSTPATPGPQALAARQPSVGASAAPSPPEKQENPFFISARDLVGMEVRNHENYGETVGHVGNLVFDRTTGHIVYVVLETGGFLGWDPRRILLPYGLLSFGGRWDRPTLRVPISKIENAPPFREGDLRALLEDPDWRSAVGVYYGSADPGQAVTGSPPSNRLTATPDEVTATGAPPSPSPPAGTPSPASPASEPKAQPGEGASGPTASYGQAVGATVATAPSAGPDAARGQALAQHSCAACHTFDPGGLTRVGPNLFGVAARAIAGTWGYNYSEALKARHENWSSAALDAFLKSPRAYAPGTYMTFAGISSDQDRADVVAYLENLHQATGAAR